MTSGAFQLANIYPSIYWPVKQLLAHISTIFLTYVSLQTHSSRRILRPQIENYTSPAYAGKGRLKMEQKII